MTVNELIQRLEELKEKGWAGDNVLYHGDYDDWDVNSVEPYDGKVWIQSL